MKCLISTISIYFICIQAVSAQSIITFQNWEGQAGAGNWVGLETTDNNFIRGTDPSGVSRGSKALFISDTQIGTGTYSYDATVADEAYVQKEIDFPSSTTLDIELTFDWKCVGEVGFDYMKVYLVDRSLVNPTESNIAAHTGTIIPLNSGNEFSGQSTFTTYSETLPTSIEGRTDLKLVFTWINDNSVSNGVPAAIDNIILSLGPPPSTLSGDYLVGTSSAAYFPSLTVATYFLNTYGVGGDTRFLLTDVLYDDATEDFPIVIRDFNESPPSSSSNSFTFTLQPNTGISTEINGSVDGNTLLDSEYYSGVISLIESENVIIEGSNNNTNSRDLNIVNTSLSQGFGIFVGSNTGDFNDNISIQNCLVDVAEATTGISAGILIIQKAFVSANGGFTNVNLVNNSVQKADYGIYLDGGSSGNVNASTINVEKNSLDNSGAEALTYLGIYAKGIDDLIVTQNNIGNFDGTANEVDYGIFLGSGVINSIVERNEIHDLIYTGSSGYASTGIGVFTATSSANITLKNNVIYGIAGDGRDITSASTYFLNPFGIRLSTTQSNIYIYNNTIYLGGNTLNQFNAASACLMINSNSTANVRNNIFFNELGLSAANGLGSFGVVARGGASQFENGNYNCYYINATGSGTNYIGRIGGVNYADMTSWRALSLGNEASIFADPSFLSSTNLKPDEGNPNAWYVNGTGVQLTNVSNDFDGNTRSTTKAAGAPDIGAFEITPTSTPNNAIVTGNHIAGMTETFRVGTRRIAEITWGIGGTLPTINYLRVYSGRNPPNINPADANYMNTYFDVNTSGGSSYSYEMKFYYDSAQFGLINSEVDLRLSKNDGSGWVTYNTSSPNLTANSVAVSGLTSFSVFTGSDVNSPLPVDLVTFRAELIDLGVFIKWETVYEENNDYFELERSYNGKNFETVGIIQGFGNTKSNQEYQFIDQSVDINQSSIFYRLKQFDLDGQYHFSKVVRVSKERSTIKFELFPNPTTAFMNLNLKEQTNNFVKINIYTLDGKRIEESNFNYLKEGNTVRVNVVDLPTSIYLMEVVLNSKRVFHRFAKQ